MWNYVMVMSFSIWREEIQNRNLLQLIWKNSVNRFYVHVVSRLHAIVSKLHNLVSKLNAKIYATYSHFQAKNILVSRFCFQNIIQFRNYDNSFESRFRQIRNFCPNFETTKPSFETTETQFRNYQNLDSRLGVSSLEIRIT